MSATEFQKILQILQRPINCLADEDRNTRKGGLDAIKTQILTLTKENVLRLFNETKLTSMICKTVNDKIENNRQICLQIIECFIRITEADGNAIYQQLIPSLISRLNSTPIPEKSQSLKLKLIGIFIQLMPYKDCFCKVLPQLSAAIAKCLADDFDQIKNVSDQLVRVRVNSLKNSAVLSVMNLANTQQTLKSSLQTIAFVLITDGAGSNFEYVKVNLKKTLSDKKKEVRQAAYECVAHLLLFFGPKYMKEYEAQLVGFLLVGLEDENPQTTFKVLQLLEKCGQKLRQENQQSVENEKSDEK